MPRRGHVSCSGRRADLLNLSQRNQQQQISNHAGTQPHKEEFTTDLSAQILPDGRQRPLLQRATHRPHLHSDSQPDDKPQN